MSRTKERRKIIHEPSTQEIFGCLYGAPKYSRLLLDNKPGKPYAKFLEWLLQVNFYNEIQEKISIKRLASDFKIDTPKATKWIREIYKDIFELNYEMPELFQTEGVKLTMYMKHYDSGCSFYTAMPIIPREFETLCFSFVQGIMGTVHFWVKKVEHSIEGNEVEITIWLEGGYVNKYREFALDKALFHNWIGFMDVYDKHSFELDESIKRFTSSNQSADVSRNTRRYYH